MTVGAWRAALAASAGLALVVAGCGGGSDKGSSSTPAKPGSTPAGSSAKKGGDLKVLYGGDVDNIDPRQTYYQYGNLVAYATQRPLYSYKPDDPKSPQPDLAEGPPEISADGKTVTVKIRTGVKFSPPVNRAVTSKDVAYALQSGFTKTVPGPYLGAYMGDIAGLKAFQDGKADHISGIETPDDQTIVFKLDRPRAAIVAGMLSMPASAPVPEEYAKKFDTKNPSTYGQNQVATGPYMIQNDAGGKATGYKAGQEIKLVRNPNWDAGTDYKPAYLDSITITEGVDPQVGSRQILTGQSQVSGDFQLPAEILASVSQNASQKPQLVITPPTGRYRYVAFNTRVKPFDNVNVRKAISAAFDRTAVRKAFGGPLTGEIPTHFIPPGQPGFEEAGGKQGPGADFLAKPEGDMALAAEYMKKAGYASGKYDGTQTFSAVADGATQQKNVAEVAQAQFEKLGFKVKTRYVVRSTMYTKFCQVPNNEPDICPSVGWLKDFADAETLLDPVFNGKNILDAANSNFALLDDKSANAEMDKAEVINDPTQRNQAWGAADKTITNLAPGIPWLWDTQPILQSKNVNGVVNIANAAWDLTFTSLK
jgi:peptide/nickel transport system substrate-binding protein